ncbi:MAG: hypothetical protein KKE02_13105 [Alphaproteobacteria bacterium]|nr:hypothetical protein [Alphaproteobacteria bacterium]MBU1513275.1 hypothetical protein [Alphaproteobacteria bacterium]MBU2093605.1 hypothetical protein [Alphaproteobacteria bacterium]MBU2151951.1 hypothetical protein [Alphaproteobacteria bacterium]MBU2307611.1 hypothetical protein [Alphaproteobacteria bacterium]
MTDDPAGPPPEDDPRLGLAWRVAPAAAAFVLRIEESSRNTRDLVDGLLFAAIQAANVSPISNDPELQLAYAALPDAPPYELRRPVSVSALAHSLRMPFETARRRVQTLVRLGALQVTPKGVLVSHVVLGHAEFLTNVFARHEHLKAFHYEMKGMGVLPSGAPERALRSDAPPVRLTNRLIWEYILRVADGMGQVVGDTTNGVILLAMIRENTEGFGPTELASWADAPLILGRPVRNGRLAARLNFSNETLRRYVIALERQGFCARTRLGLLAVAPPAARPALDRLVLDNLANLQRLLGRLRQFGVLTLWDTPDQAAALG